MINKRLINTGEAAPAPFDPLQNFETVTYTGNGGTQKITGYIRKGGAFNGSSSKIDLPNGVGSTGAITVSTWINTNNISTTQGIWSFGSTAGYAVECLIESGYLFFRMLNNSGQVGFGIQTGTGYISNNTWHNIVCIFPNTTASNACKIYIDGVERITGTSTLGSVTRNTSNGGLGGRFYSGSLSLPFNGSIDQVRIFDTALDSGEVTTLYNETYASSTKSTTDIFGDGSGIALYELDEDANTTPYYPYGTGAIDAGQSAVFNGNSSRITSGLTSGLTGSYSVSAWFTQDNISTDAAHRELISYVDADGSTGWWIGKHNNTSQWRILGVTGVSIVTMTAQAGWNHIAVVKDSSTVYVYLNGLFVTSFTFPGYWNLGSGLTPQFNIGTQYTGTSEYWDGSIDQVRIYSSALSVSDIEALVSETNVPTTNLTAHYKLDGNANDETGSYNGTPTNITYSDPAEFPNVAYNGTPTNVNFLGMAFQPDLVWVKSRALGSHIITDSIRGDGKEIYPDLTNDEGTVNRFSIDSNGFTATTAGYGNANNVNYVAWCWKAGGSVTPNNNTNGNVTTTVSANVDAGFSIVKYFGGNISNTYGHGLDSAPELIIIKNLDTVRDWSVVGTGLGGDGGDRLVLNDTVAKITTTGLSGTTATTFAFEHNNSIANSAENFIAYCFHSVEGYQKVGSYLGTNAPNNVVTTGFRPRWIMIKSTGATNGDWNIFDTVRENEPLGDVLKANTFSTEGTEAAFVVDITDTGFELDGASGAGGTGQINSSGITYIYLAIA